MARVVAKTSNINSSVEYGKVFRNGLRYVATKLNDNLNKGNRGNDYIQDKNVDNLIKLIEDIAKCG